MNETRTLTANRSKLFTYWIFTGITALQVANGVWADLSRNKIVADVVAHLGYPVYLLTILGVWKALALITILVPRFPLLKEWAYAGLFFELTGALASHITVGDDYTKWMWPLIFVLILTGSWALRPASRRFA